MTWILDLDGVVWLGAEPIPGAVDAVLRLRAAGERVLFLTNNSSAPIGDYVAKLVGLGIPADAGDLLTSAQAAARMLEPGTTALVCGGPGVDEALRARGVATVRDGRADAVVVGWHTDFDYARLTAAFRAVNAGARLIGTNDDATYPTADGLLPGGGSILASVETAAGIVAEIAGKPHAPMAALVQERLALDGTQALDSTERLDSTEQLDSSEQLDSTEQFDSTEQPDTVHSILVGDRMSTDGLMAARLHLPFALVLSGVTTAADLPVTPAPAFVADDLWRLVRQLSM
jgi:HAD superfamily hydrolase (TIGR01450 family)